MIENFNQFMEVNPHYGYLIAAAGFAFYLLGLILRLGLDGRTRRRLF